MKQLQKVALIIEELYKEAVKVEQIKMKTIRREHFLL